MTKKELLKTTFKSIDEVVRTCTSDYNDLLLSHANDENFDIELAERLAEARGALVKITQTYNTYKAVLIGAEGDYLERTCNEVNNLIQQQLAERIMVKASGEELI